MCDISILFKTLQDKYDAFFVGDLGDIIRKYKKWIAYLPRVEPFYGTLFKSGSLLMRFLIISFIT